MQFYEENRTHLGPWEPVRSEEFHLPEYWAVRFTIDQKEFEVGASMRLLIVRREAPEVVIGTANFTSFIRGVAQMCNLG